MIDRLPIAAPGMRIGLLGGSFNPPHEAHRAVSLLTQKRLGLDRVWWLVSPGNPLKDKRTLPPLPERIALSRKIATLPFIDVTGIEAALGTRFTYDTVAKLRQRFPGIRFVLLMGADNLAEFHRWRRWRELSDLAPMAVVDRSGSSLSALASPAAVALARARIEESAAISLPLRTPPAWVFLHGLKSVVSSTALRTASREQAKG